MRTNEGADSLSTVHSLATLQRFNVSARHILESAMEKYALNGTEVLPWLLLQY